MSVEAILAEARSVGLEVWAEGERLRCRGDQGRLAALLPKLRAHKQQLLARLAGAGQGATAAQGTPPPLTP